MWWLFAAKAGLDFINAGGQDAITESNNRFRKDLAVVKNKERLSKNAASAAMGGLARWTQSLNNQRVLRAGGSALTANEVNFRRQRDAFTRGQFSQSVQYAEQAGASAAAVGVAGTRGAVVDTINATTSLRRSMVEQATKDQQKQGSYDVGQRAGNIASQMIGGLDNSILLDNLDYNTDVGMQEAATARQQSLVKSAFQAAEMFAGSGMAAAAPKANVGALNAGQVDTYGSLFTAGQRAANETANFRFKFGQDVAQERSLYELGPARF